ncbi:MAG: hypothetical protein HQ541_23550, partial [Mariniphaga sp.]|nr:hypothetical protein [Mariniphaga sp.]
MKKVFKMIGITLSVIIGLIVISTILFISYSPQFGKNITKEQRKEYSKLENFKNGKFSNQHLSPMTVNYWKLIKEWTRKAPNRNPNKNIL